MFNFNLRKFRVALLVSLTIFSMGMTTVPASAIDLGAKGRYIISVTPTARAAIEAAIAKNGGTVKNKYSYVFDGSSDRAATSTNMSFIVK
jgi:hypothetical protein